MTMTIADCKQEARERHKDTLDATRLLREKYPDVPQRTLARVITADSPPSVAGIPHTDYYLVDDADDLSGYATIYSRIRRIDKALNIQVGDRVQVVRQVVSSLDKYVGKTGKVLYVDGRGGVRLDFGDGKPLWFPRSVLKRV